MFGYLEFETYMNYGYFIVTRATFIAPLIFGFYGEVLVSVFRWLREQDEEYLEST